MNAKEAKQMTQQAKKQMLKIIKEAFKCQRESNTTNS